MSPSPIQADVNGTHAEGESLRAYKSNKLRTLLQLVTMVRNWPDAIELRVWRKRRRLRLLEFRNGLNVVIRGGTNEWSVVHELLMAHGYASAMAWLSARPESEPYVLDLGGNIGLFSLLAAQSNREARIIAFEPGPPNQRMFRMNMLANPDLSARVELRNQAVAGRAGQATWNFDAENPGGSSLLAGAGEPSTNTFTVDLVPFRDCLAEAPGRIALLKMDIEGAEWDVLEHTPDESWARIDAIALELHDDPSGRQPQEAYLQRMKALGFTINTNQVCSYFLHR
jgi:FkbM family methyltransferase